jgi:CcmD family protein
MRQGTRDKRGRLRPERGDGVDRREAAAPSESERGWGPVSSEKSGRGRGIRIGLLLGCLALFALSALGAQPPQPPEGFVPAANVAAQEQLPAAPLVIAAYSVVWLLVFGYLWSIWRRIARAERDLAHISHRVSTGQRR